MTKRLHTASFIQVLLIALILVTPAFGQGRRGGRGMMGDAAHAADMQLFHQLFEHRTEINRQVVAREDGIETVAESTNPQVTRAGGHVCRRFLIDIASRGLVEALAMSN